MRVLIVGCAIAAGVAAVPAPPATACGPDFPTDLLSQRAQSLTELPDAIFFDEAAHLVPSPRHPFTLVSTEPPGVRQRGSREERSLYERGAAAFAAGDGVAAARAFEALLDLPAALRKQRSTWAAYMLGRIDGGTAARSAYARVRALVGQGFADELGLAASSLGQEARIALDDGDLVGAVRLYAEQAAHGHPDGATSLLFVVRDVISRGAELPLVADPVGQRLLAAYLYCRSDELGAAERARLWTELADRSQLAGADRLAAAAYRAGKFELARRLAQQDPHAAMSQWVLAKLDLRAGDAAGADGLLGQAAAGLVQPWAVDRAHGERAAVALFLGRPVDAMAELWQARRRYPLDLAYVAERVLTLAELTSFVDALPPVAADSGDPDEDSWWPVTDQQALRNLLARRLMRAGQYAAAMPYFSDDRRPAAQRFAAAMGRAAGASDPIEQARAWYDASQVARKDGLDILGTEGAPDWGIYGASYDLSDYYTVDRKTRWFTSSERARLEHSATAYPQRYHYRYLASALAERAADRLPARSQAFAAALCTATAYIFFIDADRRDQLWSRYVRQGAAVDFTSEWGVHCPAPAFDAARRYLRQPDQWPPIVVDAARGLWGLVTAPSDED